MNNVKVSVVIPIYQVENYLERAIESVIAQTLQEKEIILVDDGSYDSSPIICDEYARKYPDIIKVIHKENEGLGFARNTGVEHAEGEYIAFIDSDDSIEPQMYQEMYEKAIEDNYDIVICDVRIIYDDKNESNVIKTYKNTEVDLSDYLINGENITYSVNKLFKSHILKENIYERMLFEDIALIPAIVTNYKHIGYVSKPFYNYYRRLNTLSTTFTGAMSDIVSAYEKFIENSDIHYREEVIYCIAKQLLWNMTKSRVVFKADFIELLKKYKKDFVFNQLIIKDKKAKSILNYMDEDVIPLNIICSNFDNSMSDEYKNTVLYNFPNCKLISLDKNFFARESLPQPVIDALESDNHCFAEEYFVLRALFENGGIVVEKNMRVSLSLNSLRLNKVFFAFENCTDVGTGCYGALQRHYVLDKLLDSYNCTNIYNKAFSPLKERLRDFLIVNFNLKVTGEKQLLSHTVQIYRPNVLYCDMKDSENCCKINYTYVPDGFQLIPNDVLGWWSKRILTNWNLYRNQLELSSDVKNIQKLKNEITKLKENNQRLLNSTLNNDHLDQKIKEVVDIYENSACWKLTKPIRVFLDAIKKLRKRDNRLLSKR